MGTGAGGQSRLGDQSVAADNTVTQLAGRDASTGDDIATTVDSALQIKAENALASVPQQAAIVALRPSTGEVLAVAQNAAADAEGPIALTGLYPPGSTFKTVTTSAALQSGAVTPDTVLPCPATENIEDVRFPTTTTSRSATFRCTLPSRNRATRRWADSASPCRRTV